MPEPRLFSRAVVRVTPEADGESAAGFLQALLTNDIAGPGPVYAGLLTPQGKTLFELIVWPQADGAVLLDCEAETAAELVKRLLLYRLRRKLAIALDPGLGVFWEAVPGERGTADPRLAGLGRRWIGAAGQDDRAVDGEWRAHRLRLGVPEGQTELRDVLWLETNAAELNGVSFAKGCYVGQENTARMNWRQKVNRRLLVLPLERSDPSRRRADYAELGLAVDHARVEDLDPALLPAWLRA